MSVRHDEGKLARRKTKGPALYFNTCFPRDAPQAVVGLLHGYADYSGRFTHVMGAWAERGIATVGIDMRGHGRAEGPRGYCLRFDEYVDDVTELEHLANEQVPGAPRFLFGHSFGGLVAAIAVITDPSPWRGLVLSAPYFRVALSVPPAKIFAGMVASKLVPRLALPSGLHGSDVTHDPERARAYDQDPMIFKSATARWFTESEAAQKQALARAPSVTMPLYVLVGTADRVAKPEAAKAFFNAAGSADKTWDAPEGLFHEVLNEPEWRPIADRIGDWILAHK
jgi:alpha-beta hydrolase superfamily lysophospholipase